MCRHHQSPPLVSRLERPTSLAEPEWRIHRAGAWEQREFLRRTYESVYGEDGVWTGRFGTSAWCSMPYRGPDTPHAWVVRG